MSTSPSLKKTLDAIVDSKDFSQLHVFKDPTIWAQLSPEDRNVLAFLFLQKGERELQNGSGKVYESFSIACQIAPKNPQLFYEQGKLYAEQSHNIHCLRYAAKAFERAAQLDKGFFDAFYRWAHVLAQHGSFSGEEEALDKAEKIFQEASALLIADKTWVKAEFFWYWGLCWYAIAKQAGEAAEVNKAIAKFAIAEDLGLNEGAFWNDYGNALADLAHLLDHSDLLQKSTEYYKRAVVEEPDFFDAYFNLASIYFTLHSIHFREELFNEADAYFRTSSQITPDFMPLWLKWGLLYVREGRRFQDVDRIEMSFEKFLNADACEPNHPKVLCSWGEAQLLYGALTENYEHLRAAERKILRALEIDSEDAETWTIYGNYLNEVGRYFGDQEYYRQSIEKFRSALSRTPDDARSWYGMATAYYALGELDNDVHLMEKAAQYCSRVMECGGQDVPQFWNDWGVTLVKIAEMTGNKFYVQSAIEKFKKAINWPNVDFEKEDVNLEWVANFASALDYMAEFTNDIAYSELAVQIFARIVAMDPTDALSHYHLALSLSHLAEQKNETECYDRAHLSFSIYLDADPEDDLAWNDWGVTLISFALHAQEKGLADPAYELFQEAENKLIRAVSLGNKQSLYNMSCLYSLAGNYDLAFSYMEKALFQNSLPRLDEMLSDGWLEGLRNTEKFRLFLQRMTEKNVKDR